MRTCSRPGCNQSRHTVGSARIMVVWAPRACSCMVKSVGGGPLQGNVGSLEGSLLVSLLTRSGPSMFLTKNSSNERTKMVERRSRKPNGLSSPQFPLQSQSNSRNTLVVAIPAFPVVFLCPPNFVRDRPYCFTWCPNHEEHHQSLMLRAWFLHHENTQSVQTGI